MKDLLVLISNISYKLTFGSAVFALLKLHGIYIIGIHTCEHTCITWLHSRPDFNANLKLNNARTAEPNVNSHGIFEIKTRRSFISAHNIQGVPFKKVEVDYIFQFCDAFLFSLITLKDSIDKTLQLLYIFFFASQITKALGSG